MMSYNYNTRPVTENLTRPFNRSQASMEQKLKQYLDLEREIRLLEVELLSLQSVMSDFDPDKEDYSQEMQDGYQEKDLNDKEQMHAEMLAKYGNLKKELIQMLPGKNKFVEINFGYGHGMIGYFTIDPDTNEVLPEPVLRLLP